MSAIKNNLFASPVVANSQIAEIGKKQIAAVKVKKDDLEIPLNQQLAFGLSIATLGCAALSYKGFSLPLETLSLAFQVVAGLSLIQNAFQSPYTQTDTPGNGNL